MYSCSTKLVQCLLQEATIDELEFEKNAMYRQLNLWNDNRNAVEQIPGTEYHKQLVVLPSVRFETKAEHALLWYFQGFSCYHQIFQIPNWLPAVIMHSLAV